MRTDPRYEMAGRRDVPGGVPRPAEAAGDRPAPARRPENGDGPIMRAESLSDLAHVVMLTESEVIPPATGHRILDMLLELHRTPGEESGLDALYGDAGSRRETWLGQRDAEAVGCLFTRRTRREASAVAYRLAVRQRLLGLAEAVTGLIRATLDRATAHVETIIPDFTHGPQARPTTLAHHLVSFVYPMLRDLDRLKACFARTNLSPGSSSIHGAIRPLDRRRLADLLGFDGVIPNTRDALWQADGPVEAMALAVTLLGTLDRLAADLASWTSQDLAVVEVDRRARASHANPYAFVREAAGLAIGRLVSMASVVHTASAQADQRIPAHAEVPRSIDLAIEAARLMADVVRGLSVNAELMADRAFDGYAQATDLAEVIMRERGLSYRDAQRVVGLVVRFALERGVSMRDIGGDLIDQTARVMLGRPLTIPPHVIARAVDPGSVVAGQAGPGGAAPEPVRQMIADCRAAAQAADDWREATGACLAEAEEGLVAQATLLATPPARAGARS